MSQSILRDAVIYESTFEIIITTREALYLGDYVK